MIVWLTFDADEATDDHTAWNAHCVAVSFSERLDGTTMKFHVPPSTTREQLLGKSLKECLDLNNQTLKRRRTER